MGTTRASRRAKQRNYKARQVAQLVAIGWPREIANRVWNHVSCSCYMCTKPKYRDTRKKRIGGDCEFERVY